MPMAPKKGHNHISRVFRVAINKWIEPDCWTTYYGVRPVFVSPVLSKQVELLAMCISTATDLDDEARSAGCSQTDVMSHRWELLQQRIQHRTPRRKVRP